jgi:hypothetical protein
MEKDDEKYNLSDSSMNYSRGNSIKNMDESTIIKDESRIIEQAYDPSTDEQIVCVELLNNNNFYLNY